MSFEGKSVIITGAGKGIGRACAELMHERSASVIAIGRTKADLDTLEQKLACQTVCADLSDTGELRRAMSEAGQADFLVNCAGINILQSMLEVTDEAYEQIMNTNLRAALMTSQAFARARIEAGGGGAILNVSSIAAHRGFGNHLCYAASKAGLEAATRVMAAELGPYGIRVNALAPTITMTELAAEAWSDPERSEPMMVRHPQGRFAEVEDVARSIAAVLSDDFPMTTGSVFRVDGGFLAA